MVTLVTECEITCQKQKYSVFLFTMFITCSSIQSVQYAQNGGEENAKRGIRANTCTNFAT